MTCKVYHIPNGYANTYIVFAPNHHVGLQYMLDSKGKKIIAGTGHIR